MKKIFIVGILSMLSLIIVKSNTLQENSTSKSDQREFADSNIAHRILEKKINHESYSKNIVSRQKLERSYQKLESRELKSIKQSILNEIKEANYIELANNKQLTTIQRKHFQALLQKHDAVSIELVERLLRSI